MRLGRHRTGRRGTVPSFRDRPGPLSGDGTILNLLILACSLAAPLLAAGPSAQAQIDEGDFLLTDFVADQVFEIDPASGDLSVVPTGGGMPAPRGLAIDRNHFLFISLNTFATGNLILRADPASDSQIVVTRTALIPNGLAVADDGTIFVATPSSSYPGEITAVDPATGRQQIIAAAGNLVFPTDVVPEPGGTLLVVDSNVLLDAGRGVFRVTPDSFDPNDSSLNQEIVSQHGLFATPMKLAREDDGTLYVTDLGGTREDNSVANAQVIELSPGGTQRLVTDGGLLVAPTGIAILDPDTLLVADPGAGAAIGVHRTSGSQWIVSSGPPLAVPWEIQIAPAYDPLPPSDFFVSDPGTNSIYRVDPDDGPSGSRDPISSNGFFRSPAAIALEPEVDPDPDLVVTDLGLGADPPKVVRVDLDNPDPQANQEIITSGGELVEPTGIVVDSTGDYLICDRGAGAIIRVIPTTHRQLIAAIGQHLVQPVSATLDNQGFLIVADAGDSSDPQNPIPPSVVRVNPASGAQQLIASGGDLPDPRGTFRDRDADGSTLLAAVGEIKVFRFFPGLDVFVTESVSADLETPQSVTVDANRDILVLDAGDGDPATNDGTVQRLDPLAPSNASPTPVPTGGAFWNPFGIAIDIPPVAPVLDDDGDGVPDSRDNCQEFANPGQTDTNLDGIGNRCDADYNNDGVVGGPDSILLTQAWLSAPGDPRYDPDRDSTPPDGIGGPESVLFSSQWFREYSLVPWPGLPGCDGTTIPCTVP